MSFFLQLSPELGDYFKNNAYICIEFKKSIMTDTLIGRERETQLLKKYVQSGRPEFIAIYGRRRVGKTFLVRHFFKDKFDFYVTGVIGEAVQNK